MSFYGQFSNKKCYRSTKVNAFPFYLLPSRVLKTSQGAVPMCQQGFAREFTILTSRRAEQSRVPLRVYKRRRAAMYGDNSLSYQCKQYERGRTNQATKVKFQYCAN